MFTLTPVRQESSKWWRDIVMVQNIHQFSKSMVTSIRTVTLCQQSPDCLSKVVFKSVLIGAQSFHRRESAAECHRPRPIMGEEAEMYF